MDVVILCGGKGTRLSEETTMRPKPMVEIGGKPKSVDEVQGQYMGLLRLTPKGWSEIIRIRSRLSDEQRDQIHMTGILQRVIESANVNIEAISECGEWGEVDSPKDLDSYRNFT